MRRFKPGDKVAYNAKYELNPNMIYPKKGEIVTIKSYCPTHCDNYDIVGYERATDGLLQSLSDRCFEPIIPERIHVEYKFEITRPVLKELEVVG